MITVVNRTDKRAFTVKDALVTEQNFPIAEWIWSADLSAVGGLESRYWLIVGNAISPMDQGARDAVDAADLAAYRDSLSDTIDRPETYERAFALVVLDEFNAHADRINDILDAIDSATSLAEVKAAVGVIANLPSRTASQIKTAIRSRMDD